MSPRAKTNPTTTRGMIALFERTSQIATKTKKDSGLETTCTIKVSGKYLTDATGEMVLGLDASSNIPTEPVAVEARGGWLRKKKVDWDGDFSIEWTLAPARRVTDVEKMLAALRVARLYVDPEVGEHVQVIDTAFEELNLVVLG